MVSVSPVILRTRERAVDLEMRISAPVTGNNLPIILLSHGQGQSNNLSSLNGYGPLVNFWAANGFVVIQPTHLSSTTLSLDPNGPEGPLFWRSRVEDFKRILVECAIAPKYFTDLLTLVRVDDRWQIIAKVFHYELKEKIRRE